MTAQILDLTKCLARPVLQRKLKAEHAYAAIANAVAQAERDGKLQGSAGLGEQIEHWAWSLGQFMRKEDGLRSTTRSAIVRMILPMIAARRLPNELLAEAHNVNAEAGFPLTEREVTETVSREVFWAIQKARRNA